MTQKNDESRTLFIEVGDQQIELIELTENHQPLTTVQAEMHKFLFFLSSIGVKYVSYPKLVEWFNVKSPLPLIGRIDSLEKKGLIRKLNKQVA